MWVTGIPLLEPLPVVSQGQETGVRSRARINPRDSNVGCGPPDHLFKSHPMLFYLFKVALHPSSSEQKFCIPSFFASLASSAHSIQLDSQALCAPKLYLLAMHVPGTWPFYYPNSLRTLCADPTSNPYCHQLLPHWLSDSNQMGILKHK